LAIFKERFLILTPGTIQCTLGALARFEIVQQFFRQETLLTTCICTSYEMIATAACLNLGFFSIVRMLCIANSTFMEERIGEQKTLGAVGFIVISASVSVCVCIIMSGEILTGSIYSLVTHQLTPGGTVLLLPFFTLPCTLRNPL
jgi:hypothetical protein